MFTAQSKPSMNTTHFSKFKTQPKKKKYNNNVIGFKAQSEPGNLKFCYYSEEKAKIFYQNQKQLQARWP